MCSNSNFLIFLKVTWTENEVSEVKDLAVIMAWQFVQHSA